MPNTTPQIVSPRVPFLDPRSGAVSREWFQFFLSLRNTAQLPADLQSVPVSGTTEWLAELQKQVDAIPTTSTSGSDPAPSQALVESIAALQSMVDGLLTAPAPDRGSPSSQDTASSVVDSAPELQKQLDALMSAPSQTAALEWLAELQKQVNALPTGGWGGGATVRTVTVDFGATPVAEASFAIIDAGVTTASYISPFVMVDTTTDNDADAHTHAAASWKLTALPATGSFTLYVTSMIDLCWGTFKIRYSFQ